MRAVIQRVISSSVSVGEEIVGEIGKGLLVLLGVEDGDDEKDAIYMAEKISTLRIFEDENSKFNFDVKDVGGSILAVSQFTLCGDARKGRRPNFSQAAPSLYAENLYKLFVSEISKRDLHVEEGVFGAMMNVALINDGPVTILLDSKKNF